jgi:hypothetical protein
MKRELVKQHGKLPILYTRPDAGVDRALIADENRHVPRMRIVFQEQDVSRLHRLNAVEQRPHALDQKV